MGNRKEGIIFINKALEAANDKSQPTNVPMAFQLFQSAVIADPTLAEGWLHVGNACSDIKQSASAVAAFRRMLELPLGTGIGDLNSDSKAKALSNIGHQLQKLGRTKEARKYTEKSLELNPNLSFAWMNLSLIERDECNTAKAVEWARKGFAVEMETETPRPLVEFALALALLFNGQYAEGLARFESRFPYRLPQFASYPYPQWRGEEDKTVALVSEQGLGDVISFSRFIKPLCEKSRFVKFVVQPELTRLLRSMFQRVSNLEIIPSPAPFQAADCWTTPMSLPVALNLTTAEIANAPSVEITAFQCPGGWKSPDRKLHIGVAWRGSSISDIDMHRSFSIDNLLEIYRVPGVQLYSLQVGEPVKELHQSGCAALVRDLSPYIKDFADTVGLIRQLDLVVSVESALAHLCGTMGKPCFVPYSHLGRDWRLGSKGENPLWYGKTHRVFPQDEDCRWEPVFEQITQAVRDFA